VVFFLSHSEGIFSVFRIFIEGYLRNLTYCKEFKNRLEPKLSKNCWFFWTHKYFLSSAMVSNKHNLLYNYFYFVKYLVVSFPGHSKREFQWFSNIHWGFSQKPGKNLKTDSSSAHQNKARTVDFFQDTNKFVHYLLGSVIRSTNVFQNNKNKQFCISVDY
jgi:hypothetical protein